MLEESGLNDEFWEYAFQTAVYIFNRTWKKAGNDIPFNKIFHKIPDLSHLRRFGCPVYSVLPHLQRTKTRGRATRGIFVGYSSQSPSWAIYNPLTNTVHELRSVQFDEDFTGSITDLNKFYKKWRVRNTGKVPLSAPLISTMMQNNP